MTRSDGDQVNQAINQLWRFRAGQLNALRPAQIVGYVLLLLAIFDIIALLVPPGFLNPAWEIQFIGQLVERVPVPLLGLALIFLGGKENRPDWEKLLLKLLSWLMLVLAVVYFLLAPLLGVDTLRVYRFTNQQINAQLGQGLERLQQLQAQLDQVENEDQMAYVLSQLSNQSIAPEQLNQPLEQIKESLTESLGEAQRQAVEQTEAGRGQQRLQLLKNSAKWFLGALTTAVMLVFMWLSTKWART